MRAVKTGMRLIGASTLFLCGACDGTPPNIGDTSSGTSGTSGTSSASCVGPYLDDQRPDGVFGGPAPTVGPGETVTIYGHWYTRTCNDTGGHDPLVPMPPVHLVLTLPGGAVEELGEFSPQGQDMGFSAAVRVPEGTPAGIATVRDDLPYLTTYKFKVSP
jgi:hypothetical protein